MATFDLALRLLTNNREVYHLHGLAKAYGQRPSDLLFGDWFTYQLDSAVYTYGTYVNNRLEERDEKGRRRNSLRDVLGEQQRGNLSDILVATGSDVIDF